MISLNNPLEIALHVALSYLGKWYQWGGDDPAGIDCSGLMIAALKAGGILPRQGDWTADGLMKYGWPTANDPQPGCLMFWGTRDRATHIEMVIGRNTTETYTIGASGGGSKIKTIDDAIKYNAFVKIRPARGQVKAIRDPFEGWRI